MSDCTKTVSQEVEELERTLMRSADFEDPSVLGELISDDFVEFAKTGKILPKSVVMDYLINVKTTGDVPLDDFQVQRVTDDVYLITYCAVHPGGTGVRRSSLWKKENGKWQTIFHQGTTVPKEEMK